MKFTSTLETCATQPTPIKQVAAPSRPTKATNMMDIVKLDSSAILVEAIRNRSAEEMKRAYLVLLARIKKVGANPKNHIMDNDVL